MVLLIEDASARAEAVSDPLDFLPRHFAEYEASAARHLRARMLLPTAKGSGWALMLPGDGDVATVRETYGDDLADTLTRARDEHPAVPIAWKIVECASIGSDGASQSWLQGFRPR